MAFPFISKIQYLHERKYLILIRLFLLDLCAVMSGNVVASGAAVTPPVIYLYTSEIPVWLEVVLGITTVAASLLLMTCLTLCCMRLCGCWAGNIFGVGALKRPMDDTDHLGCWCCRPQYVSDRPRR